MKFALRSEADTRRAAAALARAQEAPGLVLLQGALGAGKTAWARAFLAALGHAGTVPSPTYTLVEPYAAGGRTVYHVDLYRLRDPAELEELGLRELLDGRATVLLEWPERWPEAAARADLRVRLAAGEAEQRRELRLEALSEGGRAWLARADFAGVA